tara:strand:+ start:293 stop:622 length:330 start_codon:yes stop_codon:yes gene_type:complete
MKQSIIVSFSARASWGLTLQRYCRQQGVTRSKFIRDAVNIALFKAGAAEGMIEHLGVPHNAWADTDGVLRCNPHMREGVCPTCWPLGMPDAMTQELARKRYSQNTRGGL